jgi:glycosyltransferase involved in cell wall biosynthesis
MDRMSPTVTWMLPDKLGGVYNFAANLLGYREPDGATYDAILARNLADPDDPSDADLRAIVHRVTYRLPPENFRSVLRRIAAELPAGKGVIVANDWLSLAMASAHNTGKAVVYVNHGDFDHYYDQAVRYDSTIDVFITYTKRMLARLQELLPHRLDDIHCIPYGVEIPERVSKASSGELRLLYVGRLDPSKGIFDLPEIDSILRRSGMDTTWTIQGPGPAQSDLKRQWGDPGHVTWFGRRSMSQVKAQYLEHDILVMPSRAEGLPVVLLESMAAGCVPVVSDLPTGHPEIVDNGVSGLRVEPGDVAGFAEAIERLASDRNALLSMSGEARARVESRFNIVRQAPEYQRAILAAAERTPRWTGPATFHGSRLDQPWIPNIVVKGARSLRLGLQRLRRSTSRS